MIIIEEGANYDYTGIMGESWRIIKIKRNKVVQTIRGVVRTTVHNSLEGSLGAGLLTTCYWFTIAGH